MSEEMRPIKVVLCGSMRFEAEMQEANRAESVAGRIVLAPACNLKEPHPLWATEADRERVKTALDRLHLDKIRDADEVLVINPGGYVGESTRKEIEFAQSIGRPIRSLEAL
ncbi:hypothetical protein [Embleya sp. NPDC005971]|uniref:hypothetical protein n=1 Tax=Embleya sp. NPDC005971 TaxID=3156724 RepID=UPI0033F81081